MEKIRKYSIEQLRYELEKGGIHPREILKQSGKQINKCEKDLNALNRVTIDNAADKFDSWSFDPDMPYRGIPYVQKDNICTTGIQTDCSSRILEGYVPPYSATAETRSREAGFTLLGKSNMDEFAMGSSSEYSSHGPVQNPYDLSRVAGGSSGGSAAAVAAGFAPLAFGSDTGGSVRQPASFCGLVGLRPTYGRVSRWGLIAFASSLDQIGPITNTVRDSAIALSVIEGQDGRDATLMALENEDYLESIENGIGDLRVGVLDVSFADWVDPRVRKVMESSVEWLKGHAKEVKEITISSFDHILAAYYILAPSEASSNLARYDGIRFGSTVDLAEMGKDVDENTAADLLDYYRKNRSQGFGSEVTRRIILGTFALSAGYYEAYYRRAQKVRTRLRAELDALWEDVDIIISPTAPSPPFKLGSLVDDPVAMYREDVFVVPQAMAGVPAVSINGGFTDKDDDGISPLKKSKMKNCTGRAANILPIGIQFTAPPFRESVIFRAARTFEKEHA